MMFHPFMPWIRIGWTTFIPSYECSEVQSSVPYSPDHNFEGGIIFAILQVMCIDFFYLFSIVFTVTGYTFKHLKLFSSLKDFKSTDELM